MLVRVNEIGERLRPVEDKLDMGFRNLGVEYFNDCRTRHEFDELRFCAHERSSNVYQSFSD